MSYKIWLLIAWILLLLLSIFLPIARAEAPDKDLDIPPILERIAMCESQNVETAKNPNSSASGRYQFIRSSWKYYGQKLWGDDWVNKDILDYWDNTELAIYTFSIEGTSPWNSSKSCWGV